MYTSEGAQYEISQTCQGAQLGSTKEFTLVQGIRMGVTKCRFMYTSQGAQ